MNTVRFDFIAQRHAPHRAIVSVDWRTNEQTVTFSCGHSTECAQHFDIQVGSEMTCRECGRIATRKLPEFSGSSQEVLT